MEAVGIGFFRSTSRRFADGVEAVGIGFFHSTFVQFQSKNDSVPAILKGLVGLGGWGIGGLFVVEARFRVGTLSELIWNLAVFDFSLMICNDDCNQRRSPRSAHAQFFSFPQTNAPTKSASISVSESPDNDVLVPVGHMQ